MMFTKRQKETNMQLVANFIAKSVVFGFSEEFVKKHAILLIQNFGKTRQHYDSFIIFNITLWLLNIDIYNTQAFFIIVIKKKS
jgi:hypothetical protein